MAILNVHLDGILSGHLERTRSGDTTFHYESENRSLSSATPISLSMPLAFSKHPNRVARPFFGGLIADNDKARQATATRFGVSPNNPFGLLAHMGADVAGALQILPEASTPPMAQVGPRILSSSRTPRFSRSSR
ncbi:HipA N-terminal domain-containing protein [Arthrobacter sp. JSM 101049]|uniref:HipA N-terminal domain-containing protein n=1 Tax=Arthrobacter sp. JSM 101049 TaxID=929097 RepID=UPI003564026A